MDKDPVIKYDKSDVIRGGRIGGGSFGEVFEGTLKGERIAIKVPKDKLRDDIMNELQFLAKLKHPNVVHFYGVLQEEDLGINLLFEYLDGDARTFVQSQDRSLETLLGISHDIALGMDYIHDLNIIHRDLAARNVLVDSKNVAKISDFGLSRLIDTNHDHYTIMETTIRPWRWIPRDCLEIGGKFSKSSDIWSFGVTLWEIWNKGDTPFGEQSNEQVKQAIAEGKNPMSYEMDKGIPKGIKKLLEDIFVEEKKRPSFANIKIITNKLKKEDLDCSDQNEIIHELGGQSSNLNSERFYSAISKFDQNNDVGPGKNIPMQYLSKIKIVQSEYILDGENVDTILEWAKVNSSVKKLECVDISTSLVPQILKKFKSIKILNFRHKRSMNGDCLYLGSRSDEKKEEICLFKMEDLAGHRNLKNLKLFSVQVSFPGTFPNLPGLKKLELQSCDISGDLIQDIISRGDLKHVILLGNTPMLRKEDVERLLMSNSLKFIVLGKHFTEIFATPFTPIGPDGRLLEKITPNANIQFLRKSFGEPWLQTIKSLDIVDASFNLTQDNAHVALNSSKSNSTVVWLTCSNISTRRIPDIQKKFKNIKHLEFWQDMNEEGKCLIFNPPKKPFLPFFWKPDDCLLKMIDLNGFEYLNTLLLENVKVKFPKYSVPSLKRLEIIFCFVDGNLVEALTFISILEDLRLVGITPPLTRGDVEKLLSNKSLKVIKLEKHIREIFETCFKPIGPDGNPMEEIAQNSKIIFRKDSMGKWTQNVEPFEIGGFHLNHRNIESILNSPIEYTITTKLYCTHIPTMRVPAILNKFKSIQLLKFQPMLDENNKYVYFGGISNARREDICLFKMVDLAGFSNLMDLLLISLDVSFPRTFPNLPELRTLNLQHCDISGDFINDFICQSSLQYLGLWGITPQLTKEDVEKILRKNSLKNIKMGEYKNREIFSSSFTPIGPDGNLMQEIRQNAKITFQRESSDKIWDQKIEEIKE